MSPALHDVNARIRCLMDQPATPHRTEEYRHPLAAWSDLVRGDVDQTA
ncbi:hypothetical protein [Streptomyces sp. Wh19]|uniref:Uncharacterized protein n=1 Tax=Streptomyces sanglieri TaxID=193460 RepID=A0ABW2X3Z2_9ACTN|nr:hypothetical protein [Streptomyces sp. Wh19]MDV9197028.1 hypothetical protein [Streptomyces sp. Wh19]